MIDWISIHTPLQSFPQEYWETLLSQNDRIIRIHPISGLVRYETTAWDSIRSDSHSISARVTPSSVYIQGSPARIIADGDNVFSSGPSAAEDVQGCVNRMVAFFLGSIGVSHIPPLDAWTLTRVDITRNLLLESLAEVRQSLAYLRNAEGGRYRVDQSAGDTVYWNKTSRYKKAKAYAKGPHLRYMMAKKDYAGRQYTDHEINLASNLIRLELTLFRRHWEKNLQVPHWQQLNPGILNSQWLDYFQKLLGNTIMNDEQLKQNIYSVSPSEGQGKSAYLMWYAIKSMGWETAKDNYTKTTWYRNLKILKDAGLKVTDLGNCKIIPFKVTKLVVGRQVNSWSELKKAA